MTEYREVTGVERDEILSAIPPIDVPMEGKIVAYQGRQYLYFRNVWSYIYVIDVTENVPAHFEQNFPAPAGFLDEVLTRMGKLGSGLEELLQILIPLAAVVAGVLIWREFKK